MYRSVHTIVYLSVLKFDCVDNRIERACCHGLKALSLLIYTLPTGWMREACLRSGGREYGGARQRWTSGGRAVQLVEQRMAVYSRKSLSYTANHDMQTFLIEWKRILVMLCTNQ